MCFSATASFGSASLLSLIGIASLKKTRAPSYLMLAGVPLVFAVQQFSEGCVWILSSTENHPHLYQAAVYTFLTFALVVWPSWIPLSLFLTEEKFEKRLLMACISGVGLLFSSGAFLVLYRCKLSIRNTGHHLYYDLDIPFGNELLFAALYLTATTVAPLISEIVRMRFVGALILTSFMASKLMFSGAVISVWCYFAAVISAIIYTVTHRHPATVAR